MRLEEKKRVVDELAERLERATVVIATNYRGLTVADMTALRHRLRQENIEYRVIKNNLARLAAERTGREKLVDIIEGPTAIALGYDDITTPVKALLDHIRSSKIEMTITGGLMEHRVLSRADINTLYTLPSREVLIAKLVGGLQGPIYRLVNVLNSGPTKLVGVLAARKKQLEQGG